MITDELISYIRAEDARGTPRSTIRATLMAGGGWDPKNIDEAFAHVQAPAPAMPASFPPVNTPAPAPAPEPAMNPAPGVSAPATVASSVAPARKSGGLRIALIILIPLLVLALGAGSVYAFVPAVKDTIAFAFASPQERVFLAAQKFTTAPSYTFTARSTTSIVPPEGAEPSDSALTALILSAGSQTADITGSVRQTRDKSGDIAREILASVSVAGEASSTPGLKADVYANTGTNTFGIRINAPETLIIFDLKPILGRWIDLSPASLDAAAKENAPIDAGDAKSLAALTKSYKESVSYILSKAPTYLSVSDAGIGEPVNGQTTTVYGLAVDLATLHSVVEESAFFKSLDATEQAKFKESLDTSISATGQVWIGSRSHYPLRMLVTTHDKVPTILKDLEGYERVATQDITYSDFGKPVDIPAPDSMLSIQDAMAAIFSGFGSMFSPVSAKKSPTVTVLGDHDSIQGSAAAIKAQLASVRVSAELYYDSHQNSYGTSQDPISDCFSTTTVFGGGESGAEVMSVMRLTGGGVCKTNGSSYVMSVPIPGGNYQCIDSRGTFCQVAAYARGTACGACIAN